MVLSLCHLENIGRRLLLLEAVHGSQLATQAWWQCLAYAIVAVGFCLLEGRPVKEVIFDIHGLRFQAPKLREVLAAEEFWAAARLLNELICSRKLLHEVPILLFELFNHLGLRIVVLDRHVSDLGRFRGISQRALVFLKVLVTGVETSDHTTEAVAAKALL